ncbi:MAG: hypothetical protein R2856_07005 [Caldilineaceae bacterium]
MPAIRTSRLAARTRGLFAVIPVLTSYADWALRSQTTVPFPTERKRRAKPSTQTDNSAADTYCGLFPDQRGHACRRHACIFRGRGSFTADEVTLLSNVAKDIAYGIVAFQSIASKRRGRRDADDQ